MKPATAMIFATGVGLISLASGAPEEKDRPPSPPTTNASPSTQPATQLILQKLNGKIIKLDEHALTIAPTNSNAPATPRTFDWDDQTTITTRMPVCLPINGGYAMMLLPTPAKLNKNCVGFEVTVTFEAGKDRAIHIAPN